MIRVTHVQRVSGIAGSEKHLLTLLPLLRDFDVEASMIALEPRRGQAAEFVSILRDHGVDAETLPMSVDADPVLVVRLARALRRANPDVVHTHLIHADVHGLIAGRAAGIGRIVSSRHNPDAFRKLLPIRLAMSWQAAACDRIICISESMRRFAESTERVPPAKLTTIHYGHTPSASNRRRQLRAELGWDDSLTVIGIVARLTAQKGHSTLIRALSRVQAQIESVRLVVIGDGELRSELESLAGSLGLRDTVVFLGHRQEAAGLMNGFDIFAHPSRWEGFGMVFLEAMDARLPIVATTVDAISEIVRHMETGILVPADAPAALANALLTLIHDRDLARRMGEAGRRRLESEFPVDRMVERTAQVYHDLTGSKARDGASESGLRTGFHSSSR